VIPSGCTFGVCGTCKVRKTAGEVHMVHNGGISQDDIDNGRRPGVPSSESAELRAAKRRIRELETELLIVRQAAKFLDEERPRPKGSSR
jgi:hypothetical protein